MKFDETVLISFFFSFVFSPRIHNMLDDSKYVGCRSIIFYLYETNFKQHICVSLHLISLSFTHAEDVELYLK